MRGDAGGGTVISELADAEAEEDAFLDPGVDAPAGGSGGIGRGGAEFAALEGVAERRGRLPSRQGRRRRMRRGEVALDGLLKLVGFILYEFNKWIQCYIAGTAITR